MPVDYLSMCGLLTKVGCGCYQSSRLGHRAKTNNKTTERQTIQHATGATRCERVYTKQQRQQRPRRTKRHRHTEQNSLDTPPNVPRNQTTSDNNEPQDGMYHTSYIIHTTEHRTQNTEQSVCQHNQTKRQANDEQNDQTNERTNERTHKRTLVFVRSPAVV